MILKISHNKKFSDILWLQTQTFVWYDENNNLVSIIGKKTTVEIKNEFYFINQFYYRFCSTMLQAS